MKYRITLLLKVDESITEGPLLNKQLKGMLLEAIQAEPCLYIDEIQIEPMFD